MPFYTFSQNNSGGSFAYDGERGISEYVIVEASSAEEANSRAEGIGLYFDGAGDCQCCGDRWYSQSSYSDANEFPSLYGQTVAEYAADPHRYEWTPRGYAVFIHFADGRIQGAIPGKDMTSSAPKALN